MNREELLEKLRMENREADPYEEEVCRFGWKIGAIGALVLAFVSFLLEFFLRGKFNIGVFLVFETLLTLNYTLRAIKLRRTFDIIMAIIYGCVLVGLAVVYAFAICYGMV